MRYLFLGLLAVLFLLAVLLGIVLTHRWAIHLRLKDGHLVLELRGLGIKRTIFDRDFSQTPEKPPAAAKKDGDSDPEPKASKLGSRWETDKKRIWDPENGGYQPGGIGEVLGEYQELWQEFKQTFRGIYDGMRYKLEICDTQLILEFGTGNPAHTGMAYGSIWGAVNMLYPLILRYIKMEYPSIHITPDCYQARFKLELTSIIKIKPAHIINAVLKQAWRMAVTYLTKKYNKGSGKHERKTSD